MDRLLGDWFFKKNLYIGYQQPRRLTIVAMYLVIFILCVPCPVLLLIINFGFFPGSHEVLSRFIGLYELIFGILVFQSLSKKISKK
jgi:hypothetical protein